MTGLELAARWPSGLRLQGGDRDDLRAQRLPAARAGGRRARLPAEGCAGRTLAAAIRSVHGGGRAIAPELALESWSGGQDPLSERERQVLRLAGEGAAAPTSRAGAPVRGHGAQLPVGGDQQAECAGTGSRRTGWRATRAG
jgi:hypothetical protein